MRTMTILEKVAMALVLLTASATVIGVVSVVLDVY